MVRGPRILPSGVRRALLNFLIRCKRLCVFANFSTCGFKEVRHEAPLFVGAMGHVDMGIYATIIIVLLEVGMSKRL